MLNPLIQIDFYKADHRRQYPQGTTLVYSNFTARSGRLTNLPEAPDGVVCFGIQYFIMEYLQEKWQWFFNQPKYVVVGDYQSLMDSSLGEGAIPVEHIEALHDLGYLPLKIKALPEGTIVPFGVPLLTVENTHPDFFWLVNYIETALSAYLWKAITSATTARFYKRLFDEYADRTCDNRDFVKFQGHDFSFRGMSGVEDAAVSGAGHLLSFVGTDTVPAIEFLKKYYGANPSRELIGCSVPATEHSVMCMGGETDELGTFKRLITEIYPKGIVSIVSDTWDFWDVVTTKLLMLKPDIMNRDGKVVIRPDSGDPVDIICGTWDGVTPLDHDPTPEELGAVECLWNIFGGTINSKGYKVLDPHIGLIYGDSITPERAKQILQKLEAKGFASSNIALGIGSFTYQYVTRDTYGFAVKATYGVVNGIGREIFKNPKTDSGIKKSAKGQLKVVRDSSGKLALCENPDSYDNDLLAMVFLDGRQVAGFTSLAKIRERLNQ